MRYKDVELHNVWDITQKEGEDGFGTCRLPVAILDQINPGARGNSTHGTACEIRGMLAPGGKAKVVLKAKDTNIIPPIATVYHGCFSSQSILVEQSPTEIIIEEPPKMAGMEKVTEECCLPFDPHLVRVRLPHIHPVQILSIEGDLSYPTPESTPEHTMLSYGSSITHGAHALAPEGTYAAQCAKLLGLDLINLGFGGSAHMDKAIADHIAARDDWDIATFEMGINVRSMWKRDEFQAAVDNFVSTVVDAHPDKYVFCIDLFTNDQDFEESPTLALGFREAVREVTEKFDSGMVVYVDGRDVLQDPTGLRVDLVHPIDDGMQEMGLNLASIIGEHLESDE